MSEKRRFILTLVTIFSLLVLICSSFGCDGPSATPLKFPCSITEVRRANQNMVYVELFCESGNGLATYIWVQGADTCRVGQIVRLR